jgi:hypothetical protein
MPDDATKQEVQKLFEASQPPDLGPGPRTGIKSEPELTKCLDKVLGDSNAQSERKQLIRALVLLWHDHLDAAHVIAQDINTATGSFVHGIMHRREPDYGNAAYWFRRVGQHPAFGEIGRRAGEVLALKGDKDLAQKLIPGGEWDPFAFISACESAARNSGGDKNGEVLREVQAIESAGLLDWLWNTPK